MLGVKNFSVGICDGAQSTARFSSFCARYCGVVLENIMCHNISIGVVIDNRCLYLFCQRLQQTLTESAKLFACWVIFYVLSSDDFFSRSHFSKQNFREYYHSDKQFGSRSGPTNCLQRLPEENKLRLYNQFCLSHRQN